MKLAFLTNALVGENMNNIEEMAAWAQNHGFKAMEVGPKLPLDESAYMRVVEAGKVQIAALTYCRNFLSSDREEAEAHRAELLRRIETAGKLGVPLVVTSTGINNRRTNERYDSYDSIRPLPARSLNEVVSWLGRVLEAAEKNGVNIAVENCPLMGNIAISPEMWTLLFECLDSPRFGIAYDPSHLIWQFMDPYAPIRELGRRIFHVHAKDTEIDRDRLRRTGILTDFTWWRYRLPGLGELDWTRFFSALHEIGYTAAVSIEHEDPVWSGTVEKTKQGLCLAAGFLQSVPGAGLTAGTGEIIR
ncbi:sugar phosphate isomerase/epimerase [Paenibacillus sp. GD4]|uniref:sugar phosphate isomerase/epimerase family protein n=1 Tax=Paenibacillus sp. GD4 TaxID=3068890 RepID=UPI0027969EB7|nr:sugar phosphate isomerase/epimerase [Paenibacillus sp. GD4]MDQ1913443.1 sugar phosphate isomerase/epimerase [Paenibacillus sp. GD4]